MALVAMLAVGALVAGSESESDAGCPDPEDAVVGGLVVDVVGATVVDVELEVAVGGLGTLSRVRVWAGVVGVVDVDGRVDDAGAVVVGVTVVEVVDVDPVVGEVVDEGVVEDDVLVVDAGTVVVDASVVDDAGGTVVSA